MLSDISYVERVRQIERKNQFSTSLFASISQVSSYSNLQVKYLHSLQSIQSTINFRLTGTYAFVIFFVGTVYRYMEFGPLNLQSLMSSQQCREYQWLNLVYLNNFKFGADEEIFSTVKLIILQQSQCKSWWQFNFQCLGVTWYLANDMQFFIITPPIVFIIWKWKNIGLILSGKPFNWNANLQYS